MNTEPTTPSSVEEVLPAVWFVYKAWSRESGSYWGIKEDRPIKVSDKLLRFEKGSSSTHRQYRDQVRPGDGFMFSDKDSAIARAKELAQRDVESATDLLREAEAILERTLSVLSQQERDGQL